MSNLSTKLGSDTFEWVENLVIPDQFTREEYEYPADRKVLSIFRAVPGAELLTKMCLNVKLKFEIADLLGTAVKVSEKQFAEVHSLVEKTSRVLGIGPPPVYLKEDPGLNAWTLGTDDKNVYVVITRGLFDAARAGEMAFILGHEIGHIKSDHVLYLNTANMLSAVVISAVLTYPAQLVLKAWQRRSEITADRAGLICCQDLASAQRALALISLGSRELADRINIDELEKQTPKGYGRWREILNTHPYLPKRLKGIRLFSDSQFYLHRILQEKHASFLSQQALDTATATVLRN